MLTSDFDLVPKPGVPQHGWQQRAVVLSIVAFRITVAVALLQTSDAPDEWYQSTEVAYHAVFGKGKPTWEWEAGIRSFCYPSPIAAAFAVLRYFHLDTAWLIFVAPRVYSGIVCSGIDLASVAVASRLQPGSEALALVLSLSHWNVATNGCRTLTNAAEALMFLATLVAHHNGSFVMSLAVAAVGCVIRPTLALLVAPLFVYSLFADRAAELQLAYNRRRSSEIGRAHV